MHGADDISAGRCGLNPALPVAEDSVLMLAHGKDNSVVKVTESERMSPIFRVMERMTLSRVKAKLLCFQS